MEKMSWKNASNRSRIVEAGTYHVQVGNWKPFKYQTGNNGCIVEYEIIGPEGNPDIGAKIADFFVYTEAAQWRLAWMVKECGVNVSVLDDMDFESEEFGRVLSTCKDRRLYLTVLKEKDKKGNDRNPIKTYTADEEQEPVGDIDSVPEFIKNKKKVGEETPF